MMRRRLPLRRQRGVAIITALLLTTLAVTIVASLFWQQQVQVRSMENQRLHLQTKWILRGALDYARLILREDGFMGGSVTTLDGVWATPLAETRLDDYVERERVEGENFNATLSGQITDAQSRYNLNNLASNKVVSAAQVTVFQRLLTNLQLDPSLAQVTAQAVAKTQTGASTTTTASTSGSTTDDSTSTTSTSTSTSTSSGSSGSSGSSAPMAFLQVDDLLSVPGYTPQMVEQLRPFVTVLPEATVVNVNTAPAELLAALVAGYSVSEASALVVSRKAAYFTSIGNFNLRLNGKTLVTGITIDVKSSYFLVLSRIRLDRAALDAQSLILRQPNNRMATTLLSIREN